MSPLRALLICDCTSIYMPLAWSTMTPLASVWRRRATVSASAVVVLVLLLSVVCEEIAAAPGTAYYETLGVPRDASARVRQKNWAQRKEDGRKLKMSACIVWETVKGSSKEEQKRNKRTVSRPSLSKRKATTT